MTDTQRAEGAELRQIIEQIERFNEEKQQAADSAKEVYAEAKARGYDPAILRKVIARRKRDRDDLAEEQAVIEIYETALEG